MTTFANGESAASVRTKINEAIDKVDGNAAITSVNIDGGSIDGTTIGGASAAAATFTNVTANGTINFTGATVSNGGTVTTIDINGGSIDGTTIGGSTPAAISGTTGSFSGNLTVDTNTLFVNSSLNRVGVGTTSPQAQLHSVGADGVQLIAASGATQGIRIGVSAVNGGYIEGVDDTLSASYEPLTVGGSFVRFTTSNTERMRITSAGNVGIGTTSPATTLDVNGDVTITDKIIHSGDTNTAIRFPAADTVTVETAGSERMRIDSSGNVGIGTSSPSAKLHVASGGSPADLELKFDTGAGSTGANFVDFNHSRSAGNFTFSFAGTERLRIDSSGNVGIGTTSPTNLLAVKKDQAADTAIEVSNLGSVGANTTASFIVSETAGSPAGWFRRYRDGTARTNIGYRSNLTFSSDIDTTPVERMRITSTGSVGIGTTSPATTLDVNGDVTITDKIIHSGDTNTAIRFPAADTVTVETAGTERMRIDSSGNLLIGNAVTAGTASAGNLVLVNGTAPTGNVTNGITLYAEDVSSSSELKVRDEAGNVTTLSPHNFDLIPEGPSEEMAWSYYSERDGKRINVDMLKAIRLLEQITGEKLVHIV